MASSTQQLIDIVRANRDSGRGGVTSVCTAHPIAIEAALNPEKTEYLFFVADGTGGHVFAETLAEHNKNVEKWRAIEAQQGSGN